MNKLRRETNMTIEEQKQDLYQTISDISKDLQGFRARYDVNSMTLEEVKELYKYWCNEHREYWDKQGY